VGEAAEGAEEGSIMAIETLLNKVIAHLETIIKQNERMLSLLGEKTGSPDVMDAQTAEYVMDAKTAELLTKLSKDDPRKDG
jgi:hypothetical protein